MPRFKILPTDQSYASAEIVAIGPPHFLADERHRFIGELAIEEVELDGSIGVVMGDLEDLPADPDADAQLFGDLAAQARLLWLSRLALAARKLPIAFEVNAARAARDQERAAPPYDGRRDHDPGTAAHTAGRSLSGLNGYAAQSRLIGQMRHLGFRATHIVAPKSMSA